MNFDCLKDVLKLIGLLALRSRKLDFEKYAKFIARIISEKLDLPTALADESDLADLARAFNNKEVYEPALCDLNSWQSVGIDSIALGEPEYPQLLRQIHSPPPILFYKGNLKAEKFSRVFVAIVGSRKADSLGCDLAKQFSTILSENRVCIVSGLAYGIDGNSHQGALCAENDCPTIAVLGHGLDCIYPSAHSRLAHDIIAKGGLLISQFEPGVPPYPQNFLNRNRLIAGLCKVVIIIQAGKRSGALSTARHALENGREVLVVPGPLRHEQYVGSNNLLKQGAGIITEASDIFEYLPEVSKFSETKLVNNNMLSAVQKLILDDLQSKGQLHYNDLGYKDVSVMQMAKEILELEMQGRIRRLPGDYILLVSSN